MTSKRKNAYIRGHVAEYLAMVMLFIKGYVIKERRYKSKYGEIDIIAKKKRVIVFCEVKARKDYQTAAESLTVKQKERITRSAEYYIGQLTQSHTGKNMQKISYRCDMILIIPWRWPIHLKNAW